jgi:hypothetical protein
MNASRSSALTSLYVAGPLSMGYVDFYTFLIPLYGLSLGLDASEIGILVGARSILAMFLSIHIGALMDRIAAMISASSVRNHSESTPVVHEFTSSLFTNSM